MICFRQSLRPSAPVSSTAPSNDRTDVDLGSREDPVLCIEPIVNDKRSDDQSTHYLILAIQSSGRLTCFSSDLQDVKWSTDLDLLTTAGYNEVSNGINRVSLAFADCAASFEKIISHRRPDILAQLRATSAQSKLDLQHVLLIGVIVKLTDSPSSDHSREQFCLFSIVLSEIRFVSSPKVQHLSTSTLSDSLARSSDSPPTYRIDLRRGIIVEKAFESIRMHDAFSSNQQLIHNLHSEEADMVDCILVGPSMCLLMKKSMCSLIDLRYDSLQAQKRFDQALSTENIKKRKRRGSTSESRPLNALCYFERAGILAGLADHVLMTVPVTLNPTKSTSQKPTKDSRLADALGKGFESPSSGIASQDRNFRKLRDIFEHESSASNEQSHGGPHLKIKHTSHEIFHELTMQGYTTPKRIQQALSLHHSSLDFSQEITPRDFLAALAEYDKSLVLVAEIVFSSPTLDLHMLTEALRVLLHSFEDRPTLIKTKHFLKDVTDLTNGDLDNELQVEEDHATRELQLATELLEGGLEVRTSAIRSCLEKVSTCFQPKQLSKSFRKVLSKREIILLLDVLRNELKDGGWSAHTLEMTSSGKTPESQTSAITAICTVVNCAVDALGTGLLPNQTGTGRDEIDDFISALRNDTSAVLEGVQESSFFDGFLKDFLRYELVLNDPKASSFAMDKRKKDQNLNQYLSKLTAPAALPIGTRPIESISRIRIGAGGEIQKRSTRDIQHKLSQQIGTYTFETIRF